MKKNRKQYWEDTIGNMNPDNQLELAEILIEKLRLNEESLDKSDNYDMEISNKLESILKKYASQIAVKIEKQKISNLLDRFASLSSINQKKIIDPVILHFLSVMEDAIKKDKILICGNEGHAYGDNSWKKNEWTTYETVRIDRQEVPNYPITHVNWTRVCSNCGFIEEATIEPLEVKEHKEKTEKQTRIKKLKKELKDLGGI
jgi:hypothetical protein